MLHASRFVLCVFVLLTSFLASPTSPPLLLPHPLPPLLKWGRRGGTPLSPMSCPAFCHWLTFLSPNSQHLFPFFLICDSNGFSCMMKATIRHQQPPGWNLPSGPNTFSSISPNMSSVPLHMGGPYARHGNYFSVRLPLAMVVARAVFPSYTLFVSPRLES